ncbi:hypothetical protein PRIPAC_88500 [Pristionchus pacificus]|uniref:Uncharacterized protein n=1 Tax=Pristionchus pacificus TaxID=54126 RepID=A0A2A6CZ75_PRIPA|nr:hypothetical protein PRIPAC_88500 [Pristionchus pacificus]|eukprot:PDM83428.1 hypothetical protein PRIPAC_35060 [Pristionchus pacificus]
MSRTLAHIWLQIYKKNVCCQLSVSCNSRMGGHFSRYVQETPTKESTSDDEGIYYRDPKISQEFKEGYFHSGIQFRLGNYPGYATLGRLREFNGNACPFDVTEDPRDEKINYLEEQLKEVNWILDETREQYVRMNTRLEWLESSCSEMSDELEGRRRETEELRMENVEMGKRIECLEIICTEVNNDLQKSRIETEGMTNAIERLTVQFDTPVKIVGESKIPVKAVARVVPEQKSVQKKEEPKSYKRFIKELLVKTTVTTNKASDGDIDKLVELTKCVKNKNREKMCDLLRPNMDFTGVNSTVLLDAPFNKSVGFRLEKKGVESIKDSHRLFSSTSTSSPLAKRLRTAQQMSIQSTVSALDALKFPIMDSISVPPELGQGWYRDNWFNSADIALRSGGSPHSPHPVRELLGGFPSLGVGPMSTMAAAAAAKHAGGDYKPNADDEFKKHLLTMLLQRDADMRIIIQQAEQMHIKIEAVSMELMKTKAVLHEERRMREEMMNVMVAKEKNEKEERGRREVEEVKRKDEEECREKVEWQRMKEIIDRLEQGQQALREHVERKYDEEEQKRRMIENERTELLTREILEKEKSEMVGDDKEREAKMMSSESPSSGIDTPGGRPKTPSSSRGSGVLTCFNCNQEGHYARDCIDLDLECELCGGFGHSSSNCLPSKRCYNCNKSGHRHYECKEQGNRRCFHCRKVGHLAINCKNAPKQ